MLLKWSTAQSWAIQTTLFNLRIKEIVLGLMLYKFFYELKGRSYL